MTSAKHIIEPRRSGHWTADTAFDAQLAVNTRKPSGG
jgi:hypothetical protein